MDDVRRQFETNVFGLLRMCQLVLPGMRRAGCGRIVNVSSMGGKLTFPGGGIYHATKYAVEAISDAHALRGARLRRRRLGDRAGPDQDELRRDGGRLGHAARRVPTPSSTRRCRPSTAGVYDGPLGRLGGGPEAVAKAIEKAITARRPRTRYPVTASARLFMAQRAVLPDRAWDAVVSSSFPRP